MRTYLNVCFYLLPLIGISAQEVNSPDETILTYRKIILEDITQLDLFEDVYKKCVEDLGDESDCVGLFYSIYLGFESRGQDWQALLLQSHRHYPDITFIDEVRMEEISAIISFNRLVSLQFNSVLRNGSPYSPINNSVAGQLLAMMDLHYYDRVAVLQQEDDIIGELISAAGLDQEVVIYDNNPWRTESLLKLTPVSSETTWKTPRYIVQEDLKISSRFDHDKILLNQVLLHNASMKTMLKRVIRELNINDDVVVFEHLDNCCYHGKECKEVKSADQIERIFSTRSFRLIEKMEVGNYYMARFKFAPF